MSTEEEGAFKIGDVSLYTKTWTPTGPIKAKLIIIHGFSDHMGCYQTLFPTLASRGIQVFGWDQRGWGRSMKKPGDKGLTGPTSQVLSDMACFIQDKLPSKEPVFVYGHSMGGGQALFLASTPEYEDLVAQIRGWVLESPFIGFPQGEEPSSVKVFVGRLAGKVLPHFHLLNRIPPEYLSRDEKVQKQLGEDPLCHNYGTLEGFAGTLDRTQALASGAAKLSPKVRSLFIAHGTKDRATSYDASKAWFEKQTIEDARYKTFEGCFHQLHSDFCKDEFYKDVGDWILERCDDGNKETDASVVVGAPAQEEETAKSEEERAKEVKEEVKAPDAKQGESKL